MIAVAVVAVLCALPEGWGWIVSAFLLTGLIIIGTQWILFRGHRKLAARGFFAVAVLSNLLYAWSCMTPDLYLEVLLFFGWMLWVLPAITGLGVDWIVLSERRQVVPRPTGPRWLLVAVLGLLPPFTVMSSWPLHLSFLAARSRLEHLADQVAAGKAVTFPQWAGPFRLAGSRVDPASGSVALLIDPHPSGPTGFVREASGGRANSAPLIVGSDLWIKLVGAWSYRQED